jgi:hypothetical protein
MRHNDWKQFAVGKNRALPRFQQNSSPSSHSSAQYHGHIDPASGSEAPVILEPSDVRMENFIRTCNDERYSSFESLEDPELSRYDSPSGFIESLYRADLRPQKD